MDATRFDELLRSLINGASRRGILYGLAGTALGLSSVRHPMSVTAKKGKKKLKLNSFGCVNIGDPCSRNENCCSGVCKGQRGKKGKKGKKATSRCVGHDEGTGCQPGQAIAVCGGTGTITCTTADGDQGVCQTTTGNGAFCGGKLICHTCARDEACQDLCGLRAVCLQCTACKDDEGNEGTGCLSPDGCDV